MGTVNQIDVIATGPANNTRALKRLTEQSAVPATASGRATAAHAPPGVVALVNRSRTHQKRHSRRLATHRRPWEPADLQAKACRA
jgi:hypothetical protein